MATLKTGWMKKLINGVSEKIFAISHVKSVYYNYAEKKTLANKLDEIDNQLSSVNNWITFAVCDEFNVLLLLDVLLED